MSPIATRLRYANSMYVPESRAQQLLAAVVFVALAVALGQHGGALGVLIAALVAIVWVFTPPPYAYAVGQLFVGVLVVTDPSPLSELIAIQSALAGLLVVALLGHWPSQHRLRATTIGTFGIGIAVIVPAISLDPVWLALIVFAVGYGSLAYALHRYELVRLNLISEP